MLRALILFLVLFKLPGISFSQNFQNYIATSSSYGYVSEKTKAYVWEQGSDTNIGIMFDYTQFTLLILGSEDVLYTLLSSEIIKDNHFDTRTYRFSAVDLNGKEVMIIFSQLKYTAELTIIQKDQSSLKYKMTNLRSY